MKRLWLTLAALAALSTGLVAEDAPFGALTLPSPASVSAPSPAAAAVPAEREWLVLVFINGVNDLGMLGDAEKDINEMEAVGSTDKVAVLAEYGLMGSDDDSNLRFQRGTKTLYITRDEDPEEITSPVIYSSNDSDMGSAANLVRFARRGLRLYPARKLAVVVWNHGAGLQGISFDDVSRNHIEIDSLGRAMEEISRAAGRKIDVFATDACRMQMTEVAYELRNAASVVVGSEETISDAGYPYAPILRRLAANPSMNAERLGALIVDEYIASCSDNATLSAVRTAALPTFVKALDNWVSAIRSDPAALAAASDKTLTDSVSHFSNKDSKDLVDYIDKVDASPRAGGRVRVAGAALRNYISGALLIRSGALPAGPPPDGDPYTAANGLAVYIPDLRYASDNYERLAFAADSLWDDYLLDMMRERLK